MTNPDNAIGTNGAYGGRTSVNAFNDDLAVYSASGIVSGWDCVPSSGLTVELGGDGSTRDVAVAEDPSGNRTTINNISGSPVEVTLNSAPASNSRIDAIVAYVDGSPQGSSTITDNYEACGIIVVDGTAASSPTAPTEATIRSAITSDGATGSTAYYVVLAYVTIASGTIDITSSDIEAGEYVMIQARNIDFATLDGNYSTSEVETPYTWVDGSTIYKKSIYISALPNATSASYSHGISNLSNIIKMEGYYTNGTLYFAINTPPNGVSTDLTPSIRTYVNSSSIVIDDGLDRSSYSGYVTLFYAKSS